MSDVPEWSSPQLDPNLDSIKASNNVHKSSLESITINEIVPSSPEDVQNLSKAPDLNQTKRDKSPISNQVNELQSSMIGMHIKENINQNLCENMSFPSMYNENTIANSTIKEVEPNHASDNNLNPGSLLIADNTITILLEKIANIKSTVEVLKESHTTI